MARYVVTRAGGGAPAAGPVAALVAAVEGVRVLGALDPGTALVEMDDAARARVARAHPELRVEPNARYGRSGGR